MPLIHFSNPNSFLSSCKQEYPVTLGYAYQSQKSSWGRAWYSRPFHATLWSASQHFTLLIAKPLLYTALTFSYLALGLLLPSLDHHKALIDYALCIPAAFIAQLILTLRALGSVLIARSYYYAPPVAPVNPPKPPPTLRAPQPSPTPLLPSSTPTPASVATPLKTEMAPPTTPPTAPAPDTKELTLKAVPKTGIDWTLPNPGNACWLNSILKLVAQTNYFDEMLLNKTSDAPTLQKAFRDVIEALRTPPAPDVEKNGQVQKVINNLYAQLFQCMRQKLDDQNPALLPELYRQQDAPEYLIKFMQLFTKKMLLQQKWPLIGAVYEATSKTDANRIKYGISEAPKPWHTIDCLPSCIDDPKQPLDLPQLLESSEMVDVSPDGGSASKSEYRKTTKPFALPNTLILYLKRQVITPTNREKYEQARKSGVSPDMQKYMQKVTNPIATDAQGCITFTEYEPEWINGSGKFTTVKAKCRKTYQLVGAIIHQQNWFGGHYIAAELMPDGTFRQHNDSEPPTPQKADPRSLDLLRQGDVLRLQLKSTALA